MRLVVMRHAKSDWDAGAHTDHERPLNERGRHEAPIVGKRLRDEGWAPELIASSDAQRTTETAHAIHRYFDHVPVRFYRELYLAGLHAVRGVASDFAGKNVVLLLGHNPGWEELTASLAGEHVELKTAFAALLEIEADSIADGLEKLGAWRLRGIISPKD